MYRVLPEYPDDHKFDLGGSDEVESDSGEPGGEFHQNNEGQVGMEEMAKIQWKMMGSPTPATSLSESGPAVLLGLAAPTRQPQSSAATKSTFPSSKSVPDYDLNDEENLPSPFLKKVERGEIAPVPSAGVQASRPPKRISAACCGSHKCSECEWWREEDHCLRTNFELRDKTVACKRPKSD